MWIVFGFQTDRAMLMSTQIRTMGSVHKRAQVAAKIIIILFDFIFDDVGTVDATICPRFYTPYCRHTIAFSRRTTIGSTLFAMEVRKHYHDDAAAWRLCD